MRWRRNEGLPCSEAMGVQMLGRLELAFTGRTVIGGGVVGAGSWRRQGRFGTRQRFRILACAALASFGSPPPLYLQGVSEKRLEAH